jgi:signal transduction histidine kinase
MVISEEEIFQTGPVVAVRLDPCDLWKVLWISANASSSGLSLTSSSSLLDLIHPDDHDLIVRKAGASLMQKKDSIVLRYRLLMNGQYRWVEQVFSVTYQPDSTPQKITAVIWLSTLPTEWHLLTRCAEAWSVMNSKVRHDILNQLTAILGYLELSSDVISDPMVIEFTQKEQGAAEKIREKLIFTREYQKVGTTEFSWVRIQDLITEILGDLPLNSIDIVFENDLGTIFADKSFRLALLKIIENIPTHATGATRVIFNRIPGKTGNVLIIEDNGCGIPESQKIRLFEFGFGTGNGFGLFLAQKILEIYRITLTENGKEGECARFMLEIPSDIIA